MIKAGELKPDLILLDICLPRVDGYSVCRSLRCDVDIDKIPIVFMSSKSGRRYKGSFLIQGEMTIC